MTAVFVATADVETENVTEVLPPTTVTAFGTMAEADVLDRAIEAPPAGAAPSRVTVPVLVDPPATELGLSTSETTVGGSIDTAPVFVVDPRFAVIVTDAGVDTGAVLTLKVAESAPAATFTVAGTVANCVPLARVTAIPATGAGPVSVTVPLDDTPPVTEVGSKLIPFKAGGLMVR